MFHVYVEGVTGTAPDAMRSLAEVMAARYGLPAGEIYARLARGRFRVKANVDQATADEYVRDLRSIGALVGVEPVHASGSVSNPHGRSTPSHTSRPAQPPPAQHAIDRTGRSSLPPQPASRRSVSSLDADAGDRPARSSLPAHRSHHRSMPPAPEAVERPARSSLPAQPASRMSVSALDAPTARLQRSALPQRPSADAEAWWRGGGNPPASDFAPIDTQLGALDRSGLLSLTSLDDDAPAPAAHVDGLPASFGPAAWTPDGLPTGPGARPAAPASHLGPASSPTSGLAASQGAAKPARPSNAPLDLFAPPDADAGEVAVELAADELEYRARKRLSAPPELAVPRAAPSPSVPPLRAAPSPSGPPLRAPPSPSMSPGPSPLRAGPSPSIAPGPLRAGPASSSSGPSLLRADAAATEPELERRASLSTPPAARLHRSPESQAAALLTLKPTPPRRPELAGTALTLRRRLLGSPRARFGAGVFIAVVLGFIPADVVASARERSAFHAIDARVLAVQAAVDSPQSYDDLDAFRAQQLDAKRSTHRMIVLTSMLLWAAAGAGLAYVWFRRLPWDRVS